MDLKVCRTCGENEGQTYIFSKNHEICVSAKIEYCCPKVSISEGDTLPAFICNKCEEELGTAYRFVLKCEATDRLLRFVPSSSVQEEENCKPKIEVKIEYPCNGDDYEDFPELEIHECKEQTDVKTENQEPKPKRQKSRKKSVFENSDHKKCCICGHKSASPSALAVHMRNHSGERPFKCLACDKDFKDSGNLKRHIKTHHSKERSRDFICEHCGKGFFSKSDVKVHMRTHTGETPYICTQCPAKFTQIGALIRHKKRHTGEKPHSCPTCIKRFCTKEELKYHSKVHSDEKKYSCPICNLPFKYQNNLKKHTILHSAPNSFVCNYCGRTFNHKGNLQMHIKRQHSERSGYCNICSKNMPDLEVHMWRHTGQRPLKCEYCTSTFFELKTLARHVNYRHKNPDKFRCSYEGCSMKFPAKAMLEFHIAKLHETVIPFPCDRCTRGFYRKNDLARHKIGTHKERLV